MTGSEAPMTPEIEGEEPAAATETTARPRTTVDIGRWAEQSALPVTWIALIIAYTIAAPAVFPTWANATNILGAQAVLFILALAALLPVMTGDFDLSLGAVMGLAGATVGVLNVTLGWPILLACLVGLLVAVIAGALNAFFIVTCDTNPLIITLGSGTVFTGVIYFMVESTTVTGVDQTLSRMTYTTTFLGISVAFSIALVIMIVIWLVSFYTPLGLRALFVGQARDVAQLSGVAVSRVRWGGFVLGGLVAGVAGLVLVGQTGSVDPTSSGAFLLPAYAAVFLGATTIKPGRFNAPGTAVAVYFLATGVNGLQILGADNYVQQLFYGAALVAAVVLSRRLRRAG
jgi:ribose transport system permease protein